MKKLLTKKHPTKKLLLAGAGHAHIGLLRRIANKRLDDPKEVEVSVITEQPQTIYSGMLPGWMAGHYNLRDISINITDRSVQTRPRDPNTAAYHSRGCR